MATQAGIGVLVGLGIGSGITAFLMQRIIRRQDNALQQSLTRLNHLQEDHAQDLNAALAKAEGDYEQQLASTIERYQDAHEQQLTELEAEYEARIAALLGISGEESGAVDVTLEPVVGSPAADAAEKDEFATQLNIPQPGTDQPFAAAIPDPWIETGQSSDVPAAGPAAVAEPEPTPKPTATPPRRTANSRDTELATVSELGKVAAINRKEAVRAIPQLGRLIKDSDPDVRLAAVTALQDSGSIKSIPFLRQALRDSDSRIVAVASAALSRFKGAKKPAVKKAKTTKKKPRS
ncbi:MAG: HEAT repeat domain-containing protein [Leptolyngbyaceae cyanobacterium]